MNYQKLKDHAQQIYKGNSTIERLSPKEEQGRIAGGERLLQATLVASGSDGTDIEDKRTNQPTKDEQEQRLLAFAASEEILYTPSDFHKLGEYLDNGAEQYVYMIDHKPYVSKINGLEFHDTPLEFLDRISLHNYLFPEAPYTLIGFSTDYPTAARFSMILSQPFVKATRGAEREEVKHEMEKMGFEYIGGDSYLSPDYIVEDLHPGNALVTALGNIAIIDPVIYLNTPDEDFDGERVLGVI
jgi:hypothetical protein